MTTLIIAYIFLLGITLGSFYNVVALRVPAKESIVHPPSACPNCSTQLRPRDLMPVLSWLLSRGRCRHCCTPVSVLYPLGELATGGLLVWVYTLHGWNWEALAGALLVSLSVIITVSDLKYMLIPNKVLLFFFPLVAGATLLSAAAQGWSAVGTALLGAAAGGGVILLVALASRGGMGMGDAKLMFVFGFALGLPKILLAFILACLLGSLVGGTLMLLGLVKPKQHIPFGPYLAAGALIAYAYGADLIEAYVTLIG
ncbi:prepilin peptidase [Paenibacillus mucilaginosus]|uniref:Peptidase A24A domain protein n=1 Tax=Paenibacillus mucilaginosus (strain KNP414) TaxID=1036673 RepID=F8FN51_PAEMK|nr:A24 family peptidase [Paenibacillus mucilaginosus]AEI45721.1 peptidase A24A domain protein [Paenibacillus mucilaginosus KNP414]MCG7215092.1 prepilin peptidase [Paenibacillus mucilaginosus]WDM27108.1 prepilin peptidase [Paenibacillus mucilaginosus]